eukprot:gene18971-29218_t
MSDLPPMKATDKARRMLSALKGENTHETTPVWAMRQAGRYLPEYMSYTAGTDFFHNCQTPERAAEITLQPARLDIDAAILFSDILIIPQALGMVVKMHPGKGPQFDAPLLEVGNVEPLIAPLLVKYGAEKVAASQTLTHDREKQLGKDAVESLAYTREALRLIRQRLDGSMPLIGFTGAPFTLMCYMVEGVSKANYSGARRWFYDCPDVARKLLALITNACIELLLMQIESGAQIIQVFESHGGELTPQVFEEFERPCLELIATTLKKLHPEVPVTLFARNCLHSLEKCFASPYDAISIDCTVSMTDACVLAKRYGKAVQGNLDPCIFYGGPEVIKAHTTAMLKEAAAVLGTTPSGAPKSFVANL